MARQSDESPRRGRGKIESAANESTTGDSTGSGDQKITGIESDGAGTGATTGAGTGATIGAAETKQPQTQAILGEEFVERQPRRPRKPRDPSHRPISLGKTPEQREAEDAATVQAILLTLNSIAINATGAPDAAMTKTEQDIIEPAATRMLRRASELAREKITTYSDPVMLLIGLGLWVARIAEITTKRRASRPIAQPSIRVEQRPPDVERRNGDEQQTYAVDSDTFESVGVDL